MDVAIAEGASEDPAEGSHALIPESSAETFPFPGAL